MEIVVELFIDVLFVGSNIYKKRFFFCQGLKCYMNKYLGIINFLYFEFFVQIFVLFKLFDFIEVFESI